MSGATPYAIAAGARAAASVLVLRDGPDGLEVLMLRRAERDGDARSGAAVFPGGVLDARDRAAHGRCLGDDDATWSARLGVAAGGLDYLVAAARECFEEVGLLFADRSVDAGIAHPWRDRLQSGEVDALAFCDALGLRLDVRDFVYTAHWLTPPGTPKRFDTRFFVTRAPAGQIAEADLGEAVELMWLTPRAALAPERGLKLLPVTRTLLQELAGHRDAETAIAAARAKASVPLVMPRAAQDAQGRRLVVLPHELPYAEVGRLDPAGRGDVCSAIVPGRAVRLSPRLVRVTAPNPGVMTGPGTNSYLVGGQPDAQGEPTVWAVVDPGPDDAAHRAALIAAAGGGRITHVLVTHTHVDHSPGAAPLAAATGAAVWGRRPAFPYGQDTGFAPDHEPADGERLALGDATLRAVHTPGHASNHLCWMLEEEHTLLTGDHVMQGSTVVINPPDGDMGAYLRALEALLDEPIDWFAPGHGFLVDQPHAVLRALVAHRLRREAKVLAALERLREATLGELVVAVYDDVPAALHPVARRSLLAHLLKLEAEGAASADGECWRWVVADPA